MWKNAKKWTLIIRPVVQRNYSTPTSPTPTIIDVRNAMKRLVGYDSTWGKAFIDRSMISSEFQKSKKALEKRRMKDSYAEAIIPLENEPLLRNRYVNFRKTVRFGRLLEDMDTMAVHISYLHNLSQNIMVKNHSVSPIVIVTALVDRIHVINNDISIDKNIKMSGFTSWVGKSSAEISMKLEQESTQGTWLPLVDAKFLVCARDVNNETSAIMNPLEVVTDEEKAIFELGEKNKILRQNESKLSLFNVPPNDLESSLIHDMYLKTIDLKSGSLKMRIKPENSVWMEEANLKNVGICFPEQRNLYNKIFGGYLMRKAYELAWANVFIHCKTPPKISVVDDISFKRPVLIGSLLLISSQIVYVDGNFIQVKVHAETMDPTTKKREITNDFYFKFVVPETVTVPLVIPKTYGEYMMYIDGKRHM